MSSKSKSVSKFKPKFKPKPKFKHIFHMLIYIVALLLLTSTAQAVNTATIHGAVYEWYTFEPIENAIIEVNSTPPQSIVARYGLYSFNLVSGNYLITAKYYKNNTLTCSAEETITITDDGDYVLDLLLFPAYSDELVNETELSEITEDFDEETIAIQDEKNSGYIYLIAIIIIFAIVRFSIYAYKKQSSKKEDISEESMAAMPEMGYIDVPEEHEQNGEIKTPASLPPDLLEIMDIIKANDGRITQKELRSKLKYSEAKVSLMISDLEQRGLVEKFKKGRGNIIKIVDD